MLPTGSAESCEDRFGRCNAIDLTFGQHTIHATYSFNLEQIIEFHVCSTGLVPSILYPCRACKYGGEDEYYIETRESGSHQQERIRSQVEKEQTQVRL